ncbi:MAG: ATP-binding protein [bacterium]|nr:MAG: ATP-binding protein [bacterium]
MYLYTRHISRNLNQTLKNNKSILLLGPRQVGKSTLIREVLSKKHHFDSILLQNPALRIIYEKEPARLIQEYELANTADIIYIDEIQKVPALFDSIQYLIDEHHKKFILTGSSARKLRRSHANLLPGRLILQHLDPLMWGELGITIKNYIPEIGLPNIITKDNNFSLNDCMVYGSLPEVVSIPAPQRKQLLHSYSTIYLEEEIRAEAISRNLGLFSSFLQLAAYESGGNPNFTSLSNQTGISVITVKEYYQILLDTLIIHQLPPFIKNARKRIVKTPKYYFFDIGVKNAVADIPLEANLTNIDRGSLFEHFVILEMFRRQNLKGDFKLYYWRTQSGLEVDLIIETNNKVIPIEIKSGKNIGLKDLSGLNTFLDDNKLEKGYVITTDQKPYKLSDRITVIPWTYL